MARTGSKAKKMKPSKAKKRKLVESSSSESDTSSDTTSSTSSKSKTTISDAEEDASNSEDDFLDESVFRDDLERQRAWTQAVNRAATVTSTQVSSLPMGKPRSYAQFTNIPAKKKKVSGRGKKSRK